jgi:hypothetical protein
MEAAGQPATQSHLGVFDERYDTICYLIAVSIDWSDNPLVTFTTNRCVTIDNC